MQKREVKVIFNTVKGKEKGGKYCNSQTKTRSKHIKG